MMTIERVHAQHFTQRPRKGSAFRRLTPSQAYTDRRPQPTHNRPLVRVRLRNVTPLRPTKRQESRTELPKNSPTPVPITRRLTPLLRRTKDALNSSYTEESSGPSPWNYSSSPSRMRP